jgi:hypothetical protein
MTPRITSIGGRIATGEAIGALASAAIVQKVIDPSMNGSGELIVLKTYPPAAPRRSAAPMRKSRRPRAALSRLPGAGSSAIARVGPFRLQCSGWSVGGG